MSLASFADANEHLDGTKIEFEDSNDAQPEADAADNVARGYLAEMFPSHVEDWGYDDAETPTPAVVREAASLLMASYRYAKMYSEEQLGPNNYAKQLEERGLALLDGIREGTITLWDIDYDVSDEQGQPSFWPDDTYVKENTTDPNRAFTMEDMF